MSTSITSIKHVIDLNSDSGYNLCQYCDLYNGYSNSGLVNHYIQAHDFVLLHVGQKTQGDVDQPYQTLVFVIGCVQPPQQRRLTDDEPKLEKYLED